MAERKKIEIKLGKGEVGRLNFGFARKRIKKEILQAPICPDFKKKEYGESCALAVSCKNATYISEFSGVCFGSAKASEIRDRKKYAGVSG